jgi:positive regulator of sigma E activity
MCVPGGIENKKQKPQKPPLSPARIIGELLAGVAGVLAGLFLPVMLGFDLGEGTTLILFATYPAVSAIGVYLVGNRGNQTGTFAITLAVSYVALFVLLLTAPIIRFVPLIAIWGVPLGTTIGFNLTRRYKPPPAEGQKPPLNVARIAAQFLAGTAGAFGPGCLGFVFIELVRHPHGFALLVVGSLVFIAPLVGSAISIYVVGKIGAQTGAFAATFIGSLLGWCVCMCIGAIYLGRDLDSAGWSPWIVACVVVTVGAVIGFNVTRRYKSLPTS